MERDRIALANGWLFQLTDDEAAVNPGYDDAGFEPVDVPHDWQIAQTRTKDAPGGGSQGFYPREQRGVYRLRFTPDEAWRGQRVRVLFDGVQRFSDVYLNGKRVGGRAYGYVPFLCDLTEVLAYGRENLLAVSVDNRAVEPAEFIAGGDRWYSGAGICREVWLLVDPPCHFVHDGVAIVAEPEFRGPSGDVPDVVGIRCDRARVHVRAGIEGDCAGKTVCLEALDPDGHPVARAELPARSATEWDFEIAKPRLWSPGTALLYTLNLTLSTGDAMIERFGVRSAVFDSEDGFILNGVKTKLFGVNLHHDGGAVGAAVPPVIWRRRLMSLQGTGANTIRVAHHPMPEYFYDLCDELGFMVIDEVYDKWCESGMYFDRVFDQWWRQDVEAMVRRDRNHPCVILWSVGNEIGHQYSQLFFECLEKLCACVRTIDPTRGVTAALIGFVLKDYNDTTPMGKKLAAVKRYAGIVDVFMGNYMEHFYEKLREYGVRIPIIGSEVRNYYRLDEKALNSVQLSDESPFAIVKKYDWVCGALVWAGIDYLGEASFWPLRGWTGNLLDSTGDWKLRAWYCAAQWKNEPVLKLAVYDESEPWDGARGLWGFPQMRAHWKYDCFEKVLHVAAMTNCDTVKLYQNSQTVRVARLADFPDGMVHFHLPFIPGVLRAEGYLGGRLVAEDVLYSDHEAYEVDFRQDCETLPADGRSVAMIRLELLDAHGARYMLEDRAVRVEVKGAPVRVLMDNGNAWSTEPFETLRSAFDHGHLLIIVQAGHEAGEAELAIDIEGFGTRVARLTLT